MASSVDAPVYNRRMSIFEERKEELEHDFGAQPVRDDHEVRAVLGLLGQLDRARTLFEETLAKQQTLCGPDHPSTLTTMTGLAGQ